jgi:uncharacterized protein (DUF1501 family)
MLFRFKTLASVFPARLRLRSHRPKRSFANGCFSAQCLEIKTMIISRRDLLRTGALAAIGLSLPSWLAKAAFAEDASVPGASRLSKGSRILVVVQFSGGNDGLNTLIPYADAAYYKARPTIGVSEKDVIPLSDSVGLNPSMQALKTLWDKKQAAIIQGVGYPDPNRSHFRSMEIWQTAEPERIESEGWLGRYVDMIEQKQVSPLIGVNIGSEQNLSLENPHEAIPSIQGLTNFGTIFPKNQAGQAKEAALQRIQLASSPYPASGMITQTAQELYESSETIRQGITKYKSNVVYGSDSLSKGMQQIAELIAADLGTRVFYVSFGGFDTHTQQIRRQPQLLQQFSEAMKSFMDDMEQMGRANDVMVVTFSEFGRRVSENAGLGTDHGTASEMFVIGGAINGGLYGEYPSLTKLDQGDFDLHNGFPSGLCYGSR